MVTNSALAEVKIGIVKLDMLFQEIPIYKESQNNIQNEFKPKADELKKIETSWNKLNDDYLKNERVMSKSERKEKIDQINKVEKEFRQKQQTLQMNFRLSKILSLIELERLLRMLSINMLRIMIMILFLGQTVQRSMQKNMLM